MNVSVMTAADRAFNWTKKVCFGPFDFSKWLAMGFCAFLATCGEGGGGGAGNALSSFPGDLGKGGGPGDWMAWVSENMVFAVAVAVGTLLGITLITILIAWISSRGKFMLLDNIVYNRGSVSEAWGLYGDAGSSLFVLRIIIMFGSGLIVLGGVALGAAVAIPNFAGGDLSGPVIALLALIVMGLIAFLFFMVIVMWIVDDVTIPIMFSERIPAFDAFWKSTALLSAHPGAFVRFFLLKIGLSIGIGIVVGIGTCITCCIAAIPYVSSVVFLPAFVFLRAYSLGFMEQLIPATRYLNEQAGAHLAPPV